MSNTRFMDRLFSATENGEVELTDQVAADIESARNFGEVETKEVIYKGEEDGNVSITDKETGEVTIAESTDEEGTYDLYNPEDAVEEPLEGYLHPEGDGVTPGDQQGEPMEDVSEDHLEGEEISNIDPSCEEEEDCEDEREFSINETDNEVVLRIFSDLDFCGRLFSEVIESEQTSVVGDLKVELDPEEEGTVVVTSESTGDQAKVTIDEDNRMQVTELESKNFNGYDETDYEPLYVVGVDTEDNLLVDAPAYGEEAAQDLAERLSEKGVEAIQILEDADAARDYAFQLLDGLGVDPSEEGVVEEPVQAEFSEHDIYLTKYYTNNTVYMDRLFSEAINDIDASQNAIEDAIGSGDEIETDTEIITPVDANTAVVEDKDNGEFTKVVLDGEDMDLSSISEKEAEDLTDHLVTNGEEVDEDEEEKDFSDIYCNEEGTRFFSEHEVITSYMERLYSEEADQDEIESAIESGEEIENDTEIITPIDANTAVIEDKDNGEFTKAVIDGEDIEVNPISEDEAEELMEDIVVEDKEDEDEEGEEKDFSDIYCNEEETRFFSEYEVITSYMEKLYSEEADQDEIESAIESGEQIENDTEIITPVDANTAIIEDKDNGEFTKAVLDGETIDVNPISEEEADELTEDLAIEEKDEEEEKDFSQNPQLTKFFNEMVVAAPQQVPAGEVVAVEEKPTVEVIEDKALTAIQSIQEATQEATQAIMEAKEAPIEQPEGDLKEAQFSNTTAQEDTTLVSWFKTAAPRK